MAPFDAGPAKSDFRLLVNTICPLSPGVGVRCLECRVISMDAMFEDEAVYEQFEQFEKTAFRLSGPETHTVEVLDWSSGRDKRFPPPNAALLTRCFIPRAPVRL